MVKIWGGCDQFCLWKGEGKKYNRFLKPSAAQRPAAAFRMALVARALLLNPFGTVAISKLLEMIGMHLLLKQLLRPVILVWRFLLRITSAISKLLEMIQWRNVPWPDRPLSTRAWPRLPARVVVWVCEKIDAPLCVCCVHQVKPAGNAAESGQFVGQFSCDETLHRSRKG